MIKYRKFSSLYWRFHSRLNQASLSISFVSDNDNSTWNQHLSSGRSLNCCSCTSCSSCCSCGNWLNIVMTLPGETWSWKIFLNIFLSCLVCLAPLTNLYLLTLLQQINFHISDYTIQDICARKYVYWMLNFSESQSKSKSESKVQVKSPSLNSKL